MSELGPRAYTFTPDLPPPVFEGAPLPLREFQILTVINDSLFTRGDDIPASLGYPEGTSIEDAVKEIEAGDESADIKNAQIIGLVAAMTETGPPDSSTLKKWQLAPHMGMLNAIGAALSAGLVVTEDSLRLATALHQEYCGRNPMVSDPYVSPGAGPAILAIKRTISGYGSMDIARGERGVERYISYYTYDIDRVLHDLPGGQGMRASYAEADEAHHMVSLYEHIVGQVMATREAVIEREDELDLYLQEVYQRVTDVQAAYDARIKAQGTQEILPGLEGADDEFVRLP